MADYISKDGHLYTIDEINQAAEENGTTFEDIIEKNALSQNEPAEGPGKKKPVAAKGATVTGKSTASKSAQSSSVSPSNPFGKTTIFDPLNITKNALDAARVPKKATNNIGPGTKLDSRGYPVAKNVKEPTLWDNAVDFAKNLFIDKNPDENGKLSYYDQTPIKEQQLSFKKNSQEALTATGKFEFLKDYSPEDRALFVSKLVPKTSYTEKVYNQETDDYDIVPKQEALDYITKDIDPKKFKTKAQLDNAIALNVKKLASEDSSFEFEQKLAKIKAAPLINKKIEEIKKKYSLTDAASVEKATKELQSYAATTITDLLVNSSGFQHLNQNFSDLESQATATLTKQFERGKEFGLNLVDTTKQIGKSVSKVPGLGVAGKIIEGGAELGEMFAKGATGIANSVNQSLASTNHGQIKQLSDIYKSIEGKSDSQKIDKNFESTWINDELSTFDPSNQNPPATYGEAKSRLKSYLDKTNSLIGERVQKIADTKEYLGLFNEADLKDGIGLRDVVRLVGEQTPNLLVTAAGTVSGNPLLIGLGAASMFSQTYGNQYYDTIETGLKEKLGRNPNKEEIAEAIGSGKYADRAEAAASAAVSSGLEFASELNIIKNTGKALGFGNDAKTVLGSLFRGEMKNFGKSMLNQAGNISKSGIGEYLTESLQTAIDQTSKGLQLHNDASKYIDLKEINESGKVGGLVGAVFPFVGTVKTQTAIELRAAATQVASAFDLSGKNMSNLVQVDNFFKAASNNIEERFKVGDINSEQKRAELETLGTIRSSGAKIPSEFNPKAKEKALGLMLEKVNIERDIEGKDKDLVTPELERLKAISADLTAIAFSEKERIRTESNLESLDKSIETVKNIVDKEGNKIYKNPIGSGKSIEIFETTADAQDAYDNWASQNNEESQDIKLVDGFVLPNGQILINKQRAAKIGALNVAPHELLHNILKSEFSNPSKKVELKDKFLNILSKSERAKLDERMAAYTAEEIENAPDEYITQYFELLKNGDIKWSDNIKETLVGLWNNILKPIFVKQGFKNIEFEDGRDIYNFVKDYAKTIKKGKVSERAQSLLKAGENISGVTKMSRTQSEIFKQELADLEEEYDEGYGGMPEEEYLPKKRSIENKIKIALKKESESKVEQPAVKKEILTEEDEVKEIIKENKSSVASDKVQNIYDTKGKDGAQDIINLFKPITKKIVDKRRDAPDFDRELLTDEIETGVGGILDLITKYNPESGVPLAAYINKYLPVRAIATSKRLLGKEFSKDVTEEKGLMAEETVSETKEKPKYDNALESKVFEPEELETINKKILSVIRTLKSKIDAPISINRTVTPLISEIKDEIGKQVDINVKTVMGGKKDNQLKNWLLKNKKYILENMTTTWLMGKGKANKVEGGIPNAIQKRIEGKWVSYPDWVGKTPDRESVSTDQAGRTSGAELVRRLPNVANNVSNEDFLSHILEPSGNPIRGRKESLAKAIAEETAFDIILKDFQEDGPIFEAFSANQERQGVEVKEVIKTDFLRQTERGNIKFSLSPKAKEEFNDGIDEMFDAISLKGRITKAKLKRIVNNVFPEWEQDDKDEVINKFGTYIRSAIQTIGKKYREKENIKAAKVKDAIRAFVEDTDDGVAIGTRLGVPSVTANLKNSEHIKELQDINIDFGQQLLKDVGQREGLELLASFWYPSIAGRTGDESKSIFKGKGSFRQFLQDIQDGFDNKIKFEDLNIDRKINAVTKEMVDGNVSAKSKANDLRVSNNAWDFANRAVEFFAKEVKDPNNGYSNKHLASLLTMLIYERNSALRSAAPATGVIVDPRIKNIKKYDYDHSVPARYVLSRLMDKYVDGKDVDLNKLKKDYVVTVIPLTMTESLKNAGLQSMMPYDYKDGDGADARLQYGNKDISRMIKFSLSTKANLKWENKLGVTSADFKIGPYTYNIRAASIKDYGLSSDPAYADVFEKIANNLDIPLEQIINNKKFDWVSFAEKSQGDGILDLGNSFKVFGIVTNGLIDYIKKNNLQGIAFDADRFQPSRVRLYNTMARVISNNLGWDYTVFDTNNRESGVVFAINSSKSNSFENQSKIQQEKIKLSKTISPTFNKIIEENKGVEDYKNFSDIVARRRGAGKNRFDIYVPASAADFELLLYNFMGEGKKGEEQKKFFTDTLLKPYANGNDLMDAARQSIKNEYKQLLTEFPNVAKKIEKRTPDGDFTYDQAIRVAMWNDEGVEIPGLSQRDMNKLTDLVNSDPELRAFKEGLIVTGRQGRGWIKPEEYWDANTIITDLHNLTEGEGRKKFLSEFISNAEEMFGKWENGKLVGPNINKVEAVYGTDVREALEDVLYRMTTGKNRGYGKDKETSAWANWVSGSTGAIMFLNVRSAALQLIGAVNFLNLRDNNPYAAAKAFANQKQYWEDFAHIWNSDKMKERRGGLKEDVAAAEIANAAAGSKNKVGAVLSYLLKIGYTPTQMADSFAIASGGAPFYRNRIKTYLDEGMIEREAEDAAWDDFTKVSDETQQSGDPRDISKQQASPAGRLLLTFQNTAMQQSRIVKKAFLDLKNGRGDAKTNFAKIAYYIAIQNTMFAVLQQGLFAVAFGDDDEDKEKTDKEKKLEDKLFDVADGVVDTILRGTGFLGGIVATVKNMAKKYLDEKDKKFKADYAKVVLEGANLSPPIGSKLRKLYSGLQQTKFDKDLIEARGWDVTQDGRVNLGPMYGVTGKLVEAATNVPMDRLVTKVNNASEAMNSQNTTMQRIMVGLGWSPYSAGIEDSAGDKKIREEAKAKRKIEGVEKAKETRERTKDSIKALPLRERIKLKRQAVLDRREKRRRRKMG